MQITEISATKLPDIGIKRVAAYARVSSEKGEALHSLSAQISYYNEYISNHIGWEFVGVYADEGISGTKDSRPEFQRLLADCRKSMIDLVITKSITRFARNTVTLLDAIRELKLLNIDVFFEKENLHSLSANGELMLTLLAMYAEEEARSASENQKWRIQKMFAEGRPNTGRMLGYYLKDGQLTIIPEEAEIVRMIFDDSAQKSFAVSAVTFTAERHSTVPARSTGKLYGIVIADMMARKNAVLRAYLNQILKNTI